MKSFHIKFFVYISIYSVFFLNALIVFNNFFDYILTKYILLNSIILFLFILLLTYAILIVLEKLTKYSFFQFFILLGFFLSCCSTLHPNVVSPGESLKLLVLINLSISIFLSLITIRYSLYNYFLIAASTMIVVGTLSLCISIGNKYLSFKKMEDEIIVSNTLNIFLIGFDGLTQKETQNAIVEENYKKNIFDEFTVFYNFLGVAPGTYSSLLTELIGHIEIKESEQSREKGLKKITNDDSNILNRKDIKYFDYGVYNEFRGQSDVLDFPDNNKNYSYNLRFTFHRYIKPSLHRFFTYKIHLLTDQLIDNFSTVQKHRFSEYINFTEKIKNAPISKHISVHLGHWTHTHVPNAFDENCKHLSDYIYESKQAFREKIENMQNMYGMQKVSSCGAKLLSEFVAILKAKKIYDNSIIIFKSDHGAPAEYHSIDDPLSSTINKSQYGYSRYRPFFMIKQAKKVKQHLSFNPSIIINYDTARYFCDEINKVSDLKTLPNCEKYGKDYLNDSLNNNIIFSDRKFKIFYDNGKGSHYIHDAKTAIIDIKNGDIDSPFKKIFHN